MRGYCLTEALLFENRRYFLFDYHIKRLMRSAAYFGVPVVKEGVVWALKAFPRKLSKGSYKVRLLVDASGKMKVSFAELRRDGPKARLIKARRPLGASLRIAFSRITMASNDIFLRHKTTHREIYDREYKKYLKKGFYDVLFFNERGELTEAHSSNVFIKKNGIFYTPTVSCGLLPARTGSFYWLKAGSTGKRSCAGRIY